MKKNLILVMLTINSLAFSQEKITKLLPSVTKWVVQGQKEINIENKINLQEFIENIYTNSSKYFNQGALPLVDQGDFKVVLLDKDLNRIIKKSSDFKDYTPDDIESFTFEKTKLDRFFGLQSTYFGIITIKLKEQ